MSRWLTNNLHLKVLAFTLTVVLFFFVVTEKEATRDFTVAVQIGHLPANTVVLNELPDVLVSVRGSARAFARLDPEALRTIVLDVRNETDRRWEIREANLKLPAQFSVESITPRWLELELDHLVERDLPVRAVIRGSAARGHEAKDPIVTPASIRVSAPSTYFPDLDALFTESIDISGADQDITRTTALAIQRPFVTTPADARVQVEITVAAIVEQRTLVGVPMLITGPRGDRCALDVGSITVTVAGPKTLIDALSPHDIFGAVECATYVDLGPGVYTPRPTIENLAASMETVETIPATLQLTVLPPAPEPVPEPALEDGDE